MRLVHDLFILSLSFLYDDVLGNPIDQLFLFKVLYSPISAAINVLHFIKFAYLRLPLLEHLETPC